MEGCTRQDSPTTDTRIDFKKKEVKCTTYWYILVLVTGTKPEAGRRDDL